jgi:outer membrane protein OmpA-like peptidoglycan-associated protein
MKKILRIALTLFAFYIGPLQAQNLVADYRRTADIYYAKKDFYTASQYYQKVLGDEITTTADYRPYNLVPSKKQAKVIKDQEEVIYRLAESYRQFYDFANAEKWYAQAINFDQTRFPLARYWYAVCLRASGNYADALTQFNLFRQSYKGYDSYVQKALTEIDNCNFAVNELKKTPRYEVVRATGSINQGGANYAIAPMYDGRYLFTSSRPQEPIDAKKPAPFKNDLYIASGHGQDLQTDQYAKIPEMDGIDQGAATVSTDCNTIYFTKWSMQNGTKHSEIYKTQRSGGAWSKPTKLDANVNVPGYNAKEPFLSSDGKYFLFASDRPGGMGKFDLWYCTISEAGLLSAASNMGTTINTKDDDAAPFYDPNREVLIFSTDGRLGFGGMDFFMSKGGFKGWEIPENMGVPFNSPKDDMYYSAANPADALGSGYISSDRESVCCLEIYSVKRKVKMAGGLVLDCDNSKPLPGVKVSLFSEKDQKLIETQTTNAVGTYAFEVEMNQKYRLIAEKTNYFSKTISLNTEHLSMVDSMTSPTICLKEFEVDKPIVINNIMYDYNKATLRPESMQVLDTLYFLLLDNPTIVIELGAHTDSKGSDAYNLKLSQQRAKSCVDYLISKGIPYSRVISKGYGESRPIAPNELPNGEDNPDGRQLNRRTEFKVLRTQ